jgi:hypothetical protein
MSAIYAMLHRTATRTATTILANVDGSSVSVPFRFTVPAGKTAKLTRLNVEINDASIDQSKFGGVTARANGLTIYTETAGNTVIEDLTGLWPIKKNGDWAPYAGPDGVNTRSTGAGDDLFVCRWTFSKAGQPITLQAGQSFVIEVHDDLRSLTQYVQQVQGYYL